jgi:hypothetical protein
VTITDASGESKSFFFMGGSNQCPHINHSGNTGAVTLNEPGNGDFNPWAPTWASGEGKSRPAPGEKGAPDSPGGKGDS